MRSTTRQTMGIPNRSDPAKKGSAASSIQTPLLNTRSPRFHWLVCSRTVCESNKHRRNPSINPISRFFKSRFLPDTLTADEPAAEAAITRGKVSSSKNSVRIC